MGRYRGYPQYVPVSVYKKRNRKAAEKLKKKYDIQPIQVEGRKIAKTWWGEHWCENLERYADLANRVGRGRKYVRYGAVLNLDIEEGKITGMVQGSRSNPYTVLISVKKLSDSKWSKLCRETLSSVESLSGMLAGKFPSDLKELFFAKKDGIYPDPGEISFECSCPDSASMCKHIAAVLYGVGSRLDDKPELLFTLRNVSMEELVDRTLTDSTSTLMEKADEAAGDGVIDNADLGDVFGIEMDDSVPDAAPLPPSEEVGQAGTGQKSNTEKSADPDKSGGARSKPKKSSGKPPAGSVIGQFMQAARRADETFRAADLKPVLPEWPSTRITNTLQRTYRKGWLEKVSRGVYRCRKL